MYSKLPPEWRFHPPVEHLFMSVLRTVPDHHTSSSSRKGLTIYFQTIQRDTPINIRIHWVYHLSLSPTLSTLQGLCDLNSARRWLYIIRLKWTVWMLPEQQKHSSCFPGVWMCVAPPSCLNRSLLEELARLPTKPLIPSGWGKSIQSRPA